MRLEHECAERARRVIGAGDVHPLELIERENVERPLVARDVLVDSDHVPLRQGFGTADLHHGVRLPVLGHARGRRDLRHVARGDP